MPWNPTPPGKRIPPSLEIAGARVGQGIVACICLLRVIRVKGMPSL